MKKFFTNQKFSINIEKNKTKLIKLKDLLQNSKIKTITQSHVTSNVNSLNSSKSLEKLKNSFYCQKTSFFDTSSLFGFDLSKDFSLYFILTQKPINLLFSIDQFLFEFSKKTYQQKRNGEFFQQLKERKKLSLFYGNLTRKQILNLFNKVKTNKGDFFKNVFSLLEKRLDVVLYRSGFTQTLSQARQLIKHNKILVNQKIINLPSFLLKPGDFVSMTPKTTDQVIPKLVNSLKRKTRNSKPSRPDVGDFYSKLEKSLEFSFPKTYEFSSQKQNLLLNLNQKNEKSSQKFQSKILCKHVIQLICARIKSRSFWNLNSSNFFSMNLNLKNSSNFEKKPFLTLFKWKSLKKKMFLKNSKVSSFFQRTKSQSFRNLAFKQNSTKKNVYANQGCLQKKPGFWNLSQTHLIYEFVPYSSFSQRKQDQNFFDKGFYSGEQQGVQNSLGKTKSEFCLQRVSKNVRFFNFKKKNLLFYRKSFLVFLKQLEKSYKFTNLMSLSMKKFVLKKSIFTQKLENKSRNSFKFSKNLTFRISRPLHVEISYNLLNLVYLFSPQRINFPFSINLDLIKRSLR